MEPLSNDNKKHGLPYPITPEFNQYFIFPPHRLVPFPFSGELPKKIRKKGQGPRN
jgi:hypothetical protein